MVWIKNDFNIISARLLKRRVGQFGPETIGHEVKSEGSYILIYSLFWACMASWVILDLWTFDKP